jgi:hypothetical protein
MLDIRGFVDRVTRKLPIILPPVQIRMTNDNWKMFFGFDESIANVKIRTFAGNSRHVEQFLCRVQPAKAADE